MALKQNIIYIYFKGKHLVTSKSQYQYNHGQFLYFADLDLPQAFEVHFSSRDRGESKTQIGSNKLVEIPDEYFWNGALQIYAWIYLHSQANDGETVYEVKIPLIKRAKPTDEEPLPVQQSTIDRVIAELNVAVEQTSSDAEQTGLDRQSVANMLNTVTELEKSASQSAQTATEKAQQASTSANNAEDSEQEAKGYANDAKRYSESAFSSKEIAVSKANDAQTCANNAEQSKIDAETAKSQTVQLKQDVVEYKDETEGYKNTALTTKNEVIGLKNQIDATASNVSDTADAVSADALSASQSAESARQSASSASQSSQSASQSATSAGESETSALTYKTQAQTFRNEAEQFKNLSDTNVTHYPKVIDGFWYVWDASNEIYVNTNVDARGIKGDKGDVGDTGNGIESTVLNSDYTLTITFTDGTSYTTPSIRGEKGIKGDVGNGIASTVLNNDYTLTINFTNGTQYTTPPIRGKQGEKGNQGEVGESGVYIGADEPTDEDINVWIDTDESADSGTVEDLIEEVNHLKSGFTQMTTATASDVGKALKAKRVVDGKVVDWEFGEAGGNNELLDNLSFDADNVVYHRNGEEYTKKVQFADGAIINGNMDTQPVIVAHGKGLYTGDPQDKAGLCVTKTYPIGGGYTVIYYLSNPESVSVSGVNRYQDMDGTTILASRTVTVGTATETTLITGNGIRFTLFEAGVNDSYAYIKQTGEVLFAGKDSAYFGMRNIDGTKAPSATLISDKNAEDKLLSRSGLIVGKDGLVHLAYDGGASAGIGIQFAEDAIVNAQYDTKIRIAEYGKLIDGVTPYVPRVGGCYTEFYDLVSENAVIKYYFSNPDGASFSNNNKIEWYRGDTYVGRSNETLNSVAEASCSNTETKANKFRVSLATAGIDDSYCYDKATGTVIFAGKNTAYYGLNNIADQPDPDPRDYGIIGANYPEETEFIDKNLANATSYTDETGITNRFAFCHVSDVHMHSASVRGFGYADEFTDLSDATFLALTGDNVSNTATDTFDHAKTLIDGMTKPCYITFGNHDVYGSTSLSSRFDHQFAQIKDHNGQSTLSTTYYAVDFPLGKQAEKLDTGGVNDDCSGIKCIFLDCYDGVDDYTGQNMSYICDGHMSATQINWLATQLQDAITNKYHVCIFMHHAPDDCGMMIDKFFDSHGYASNLLFIAKMVDAFQTYNGSVTFEHMGASYTFTFSGSGHFVSYFVGHTHCDGACWLKSYPRQLSVGIVTPSGSGSGMNGTNMNTGLGVMFNYVTIDKKKRKVTVFRVGNQDTYYGYKRDLFSVRYY